ncbi:hypothetical protein FJ987_10910 [Mesorhizobium sp. CU2]|uniref:hypothetical protein n=1 Tax=unclassified Mesorhizobium TaxID=325217 RepID=UPI001126D445|nr:MULTISPECIES: hypothetical protein [unclassified Mesorhizobium]TPN82684.1 hypothetical protein FJ988_16175 [Mesorhizobium sp. CU3]TPO16441.1 hypothetical protein FJ987_10910 [Mesorhizobium sp. CU2]
MNTLFPCRLQRSLKRGVSKPAAMSIAADNRRYIPLHREATGNPAAERQPIRKARGDSQDDRALDRCCKGSVWRILPKCMKKRPYQRDAGHGVGPEVNLWKYGELK